MYVLCRRQNRPEESKIGSRSCQIHSTARTETRTQQWQYDHWIAKDAKKKDSEEENTTLLCTDGLLTPTISRIQWNHGWTEEYCRYLDYLLIADVNYIATWPERARLSQHARLAWRQGGVGRRKDWGGHRDTRVSTYDLHPLPPG